MKKKKKKKKTPILTYRLFKSSVYVIHQIRDLTNSNDMHYSLHLIERKKSLFEGILKIFGSRAGTMTQLIQFYRRERLPQKVTALTLPSSSTFINGLILILYHTNVYSDNILNNFEFEGSRAKVKVTVAIFRKKTWSLLKHLHLRTDFAVTSHKCLV